MPGIGEFIASYRILAQISSDATVSLYVAERSSETTTVLLLYSPLITLETPEQQNGFLDKMRTHIIQRKGQNIEIQDVGIADQHPYLVTAYSDEIQQIVEEQTTHTNIMLVSALDQGFSHANLSSVFARSFTKLAESTTTSDEVATPPQPQSTESSKSTTATAVNRETTASSWKSPIPWINRSARTFQWNKATSGRKLKKWQAGVLLGTSIVVILALLAWMGSYLYTVIPASAATVNIIPAKNDLKRAYTLTVVVDAPSSPSEVQGRLLTFTTQPQSRTVSATGQGTDSARSATGTIVLSQISLTDNTPNRYLAISSVDIGNGLTVTTDQEVPISNGATVTIQAHITPAGSAGNISAGYIGEQTEIVDAMTQAQIGTGYVTNPHPFSGGTDATGYSYVQQSDIDSPTRALISQLTTQAKAQVQQQIHQDEHTTQAIQCTPDTSSNHQARDRVDSFTVKVSVTCTTLVYTNQALHDTAVRDYQKDGIAQFGNSYGIVGDMIVSQPAAEGPGIFSINIDGIWSFQYTPAHLQDIQHLIAGHSKADALKLLHARHDIQKATLVTTGGLGTAVPWVLNDIKLIVAKVDGLHAYSSGGL